MGYNLEAMVWVIFCLVIGFVFLLLVVGGQGKTIRELQKVIGSLPEDMQKMAQSANNAGELVKVSSKKLDFFQAIVQTVLDQQTSIQKGVADTNRQMLVYLHEVVNTTKVQQEINDRNMAIDESNKLILDGIDKTNEAVDALNKRFETLVIEGNVTPKTIEFKEAVFPEGVSVKELAEEIRKMPDAGCI